IATIGDMPNDVPMLTAAGLGIAMGNAAPDVQRFARHVTRSNDDEGFAHAIDTFVLGAPPFSRTALGLPPRVRALLFGFERDQAAVFDDCREGLEAGRTGHFGYVVGVEGLGGISALRGQGADVIVPDLGDLLGSGEREIAAPGPP